MNIVFVFGSKWPSTGAGTSFTTLNCHGLAKADPGNNIELLVTKNTVKPSDEELTDYFGLTPLENLNICMLEEVPLFSITTVFYIKAYKKLVSDAKKGKVDVVITRKVGFLPYLYLLKKKYDLKVYFEAHDFYLDLSLRREKKAKKHLFQKWFLPKTDGIICHQVLLKDLYQKYLSGQRFCIARTGVKHIIKDKDLWDRTYLGYIGTIDDRKRVKDIIYALKEVKDQDLKLLIIGGRDKEKNDNLLDFATTLGLDGRVEITGWISQRDIEKYLKKIKIGIVPLEDTFFNKYLTSPMKIFNYFSYGIPVIGSDLPSVREIVTERGGLFYSDMGELSRAINKLNSSEELYHRFSEYILQKSANLLWENRGKKILKFIEQTQT